MWSQSGPYPRRFGIRANEAHIWGNAAATARVAPASLTPIGPIPVTRLVTWWKSTRAGPRWAVRRPGGPRWAALRGRAVQARAGPCGAG